MTMTKEQFLEFVRLGYWSAFVPEFINHERVHIIVDVPRGLESPYSGKSFAVFGVPFDWDSENATAYLLDVLKDCPAPVRVRTVWAKTGIKECSEKETRRRMEKPLSPENYLISLQYGMFSVANVPFYHSPFKKAFVVKDFDGNLWAADAPFHPESSISPGGPFKKALDFLREGPEVYPVELDDEIVAYIPVD